MGHDYDWAFQSWRQLLIDEIVVVGMATPHWLFMISFASSAIGDSLCGVWEALGSGEQQRLHRLVHDETLVRSCEELANIFLLVVTTKVHHASETVTIGTLPTARCEFAGIPTRKSLIISQDWQHRTVFHPSQDATTTERERRIPKWWISFSLFAYQVPLFKRVIDKTWHQSAIF